MAYTAAPDVGTGATIAFTTTAKTFKVRSIKQSGLKREVVDTTHLGTTTAKTFMPGDLIDGGEIEVELLWEPGAAGTRPSYAGAIETVTITVPMHSGGSVAAAVAFSGVVMDVGFDVPLDALMISTFKIKITGDLTWTAAS
jgi:hypothetical protein